MSPGPRSTTFVVPSGSPIAISKHGAVSTRFATNLMGMSAPDEFELFMSRAMLPLSTPSPARPIPSGTPDVLMVPLMAKPLRSRPLIPTTLGHTDLPSSPFAETERLISCFVNS